jgi:1-acyl-sn-glycerol-3-phosphate acyltransferase
MHETKPEGRARRPAGPGVVLRSSLFAVGMALATTVFAIVAIAVVPLPFPLRYRIVTGWTRFNLWWLGVTCGLHYSVEGRENIPVGSGVIMAKHQSAWETLALQRVFPAQTWVLKRELLWIPLFGWGLAVLEPIAIDRKAGRRAIDTVLKVGQRRLADGRWIVVFPEGTRVAPGERGRYGSGGALLAVRSGHPVVPVAHDAGVYWPRKGFLKYPGTIRLVVGPPIDPTGRTAQEVTRAVEDWIETTMRWIHPAGADGAPAARVRRPDWQPEGRESR